MGWADGFAGEFTQPSKGIKINKEKLKPSSPQVNHGKLRLHSEFSTHYIDEPSKPIPQTPLEKCLLRADKFLYENTYVKTIKKYPDQDSAIFKEAYEKESNTTIPLYNKMIENCNKRY